VLQTRRIGAVEVLALILTPLIWPVGVILLWLSPAWSVRDRLIGALLPPGGYLMVLLLPSLVLLGAVRSSSCVGVDSPPGVTPSCAGLSGPAWQQDLLTAALIFIIVVWFALPILTGTYMAWRLRRWSSRPQT